MNSSNDDLDRLEGLRDRISVLADEMADIERSDRPEGVKALMRRSVYESLLDAERQLSEL